MLGYKGIHRILLWTRRLKLFGSNSEDMETLKDFK